MSESADENTEDEKVIPLGTWRERAIGRKRAPSGLRKDPHSGIEYFDAGGEELSLADAYKEAQKIVEKFTFLHLLSDFNRRLSLGAYFVYKTPGYLTPAEQVDFELKQERITASSIPTAQLREVIEFVSRNEYARPATHALACAEQFLKRFPKPEA